MKIEQLLQIVDVDALIVVMKGNDILGNIWKDDVSDPSLLDLGIYKMHAFDKSILILEVQ